MNLFGRYKRLRNQIISEISELEKVKKVNLKILEPLLKLKWE